MNEILSKFDSGEMIGVIAVAGAFLCGILGICLGFFAEWQKSRRAEIIGSLKQDMLNRGMSVDDIERVVSAGSPRLVSSRRSCSV